MGKLSISIDTETEPEPISEYDKMVLAYLEKARNKKADSLSSSGSMIFLPDNPKQIDYTQELFELSKGVQFPDDWHNDNIILF